MTFFYLESSRCDIVIHAMTLCSCIVLEIGLVHSFHDHYNLSLFFCVIVHLHVDCMYAHLHSMFYQLGSKVRADLVLLVVYCIAYKMLCI